MQDDLSMILKGKLDIEKSVSNIDSQIKELQKRIKELNISINIDGIDKVFKDLAKEVSKQFNSSKTKAYDSKETKVEIDKTIKDFKQLKSEIEKLKSEGFKKGKVSTSFIDTGNGESVKKIVTEFNDELKNTIRITENINAETGKLVSIEKTVIDNIKQRNNEQEKLAETIAKGREKAESKILAIDRKEELKQAQAINKALDEQYEEQEKLKNQVREIALLKKQSEATIDNIVKSNDGADAKRATDLKNALLKVNPEAKDAKLQIRELNAEIKEFGVRSKEASSTSNSFSDSLKRFTAFYGLYDLFQLGKRSIESMVDSIFELDHALVELQKTSNLSGNSLKNFVNQSYQIGKELSRTGADVINASAEFSKAGFGDGEIANLAKTALLLTNVGDGIKDVSEASGTLVSAMKGFGIESKNAIDIVDKINAVSNSTASNFEDISFGLERMSGTLGMAGTSIDETIGMFTAVNEILRNSEIVSSGISSTFMRMRGVSEETGESVDGLKAKLEDVYKTVGVSMVDSSGQLRDTFDVLNDLNKQWGSLTTNQKQFIAEESAGIRQSKVFITLMEQWDTVQKSINTSLSSSGSAMQENEKFLNSLEGKVNNVKSAWEQLSSTTVNSDFVKGILDATAGMIRMLDTLGGLVPLVTTFAGALVIFKTTSIIDFISRFSVTTGNLGVNFTRAYTAIGLYNKGMLTTKALTMSLVPIMGALTIAISGAVMAYNAWKQTQEENSRRLQEKIDKTREEVESINGLVSSYDDLRKSSKTDKESRDKLLQVQKDIVKALGLEKDAIDLVNGSYEDNIDVINRANKEKLEQLEIDAKIKYQEDTQKLDKIVKDVAKTNLFKVRSIANDEELASARRIAEQMSNEFGEVFQSNFMKGLLGGGSFAFNIDSDSQQEMYSALTKLKELMADEGFTGTKQYATISKELEDLKSAMDAAGISTENYTQAQADLLIQSEKTKLGIGDVEAVTKEQYELMKQNISKNFMNGLSMTSENAEKMKKALVTLDNMFPQFSSSVEESGNSAKSTSTEFETLLTQLEEITSKTSEQVNGYNLLTNALDKLNSGQKLSGEEIYNLTNAYNELTPKIDDATGQMYLEKDAIFELAEKQGIDAQQGIQAQINKTKQVAVSTAQRIGLMYDEILAINSVADAYAYLSGSMASQYGNNLPTTALSEEDFLKNASQSGSKIQGLIGDLANLYEEAEKTSASVANVTEQNENRKSSSSKSDNPFQKDIDKIKQAREEIEREIAIIQSKLDLSEMQGDTKAFDEYSDKMTLLLAKQKELADIEVNKFKGLQGKYKKEEEQLTLNELIAESTRSKYADEKDYLEQTISLIQRKTDMVKRAYDDKVSRIELEQSFAPEDSNEWKEMEEEKMSLLLSMQESYQSKIKQLKELGLSNEQEIVRQYIDAWKDYEQQRIDMERNIAEKRKESELKRLNDLNTDLKEKEDLTKKHIENTMAMLREQYQEEKKMIEDNYKAKEEKLKKELDGYKKIIDAKKKSLQDEADTEDYEDKLQEYNKEIADMKNQAALLGKDETAVVEYENLLDEIAKKEKEKEKYQRDYNIKLQQESLDKEYELYEQNINNELDALKEQKDEELSHVQNMLDSEVKLRREAIRLIEKDNDKLYKQLMKWAEETGSKTKDEITEAWEGCTDAIDGYNNGQMNVLDTLQAISDKLKEVKFDIKDVENSHWTDWDNNPSTGSGQSYNKPSGSTSSSSNSSNNSSGSQLSQKAKEQLNQQKYLHEQMLVAIETDNEGLKKWIREQRKKYGLDPSTGAIVKQFHTGINAGRLDGLKADETIVKALNDEWFVTNDQMKNLKKNLDGLTTQRGMGDISISIDALMKDVKIDKDINEDAFARKITDKMFIEIKRRLNMRGR